MSNLKSSGVAPAATGVATLFAIVALSASVLGGCMDLQPVASEPGTFIPPAAALQAFDCTVSRASMRCTSAPEAGGPARVITGGQGTNVQLTSSNVSYNADTDILSADVTIQNLMNEAMGTPDGTTVDPQGIQVFFHEGPVLTNGTGNVSVFEPDGTAFFTAPDQPYFAYHEILSQNEVSASNTWTFQVDGTVVEFTFRVYVETDLQYLLVINEVMVNPLTEEPAGEWFELYNAGSRRVQLQNLVIADSAASGRRPYHLIASSVVVQPGAYVVLGNNSNTTTNGGVTLDYSYGGALLLANSLDAVKVSRVFGTDTLTVDRAQFSSAATSAQSGISRELKNPALDNANMDGSNWDNALVTAVYGAGGRGTPGAQNSTYTP